MDIINYLEKDYNIFLNEQQKKAVKHSENPAIVLAVAGSGKTTSLVARTANLIVNHNVRPE